MRGSAKSVVIGEWKRPTPATVAQGKVGGGYPRTSSICFQLKTWRFQAVLVHVLRHLAKSNSNLWKAIAAGFDDAASEVAANRRLGP
jgi:hypothetical protein